MMRRYLSNADVGPVLISVAAALSLAGCATSKPSPTPSHRWFAVGAIVDHVPLQGLSTVPRVVAEARPLVLANVENNEERESKRQADVAVGTAGGAAAYGIRSFAALFPLCIPMPALCAPFVAWGAVDGASRMEVAAVSPDDAGRIASIFREHATSAALQHLIAKQMPAAAAQGDELRLHVVGVVMVPTRQGVTFRMVAQAQAFPLGKEEWKPSVHYVLLPLRSVEEWLASGGEPLKADIEIALDALSRSITPAYMRYRHPLRTP